MKFDLVGYSYRQLGDVSLKCKRIVVATYKSICIKKEVFIKKQIDPPDAMASSLFHIACTICFCKK